MRMYIAGQWVGGDGEIQVLNPFDLSVIDTVPRATPQQVDSALDAAVAGAGEMERLSAYDRYAFLNRAAQLLESKSEEFARCITLEEGKPLRESRVEVARAIQTLVLSAEEAKRLYGETVPLDANPMWNGEMGFTLRVPCGVVVAITPFNYPLNLVMHKVAPALAAGNSVIIKPASDTPLSALKLVEVLLEAGAPARAVQCVVGNGSDVGMQLVSDKRVRKVSFTGSLKVGEQITAAAGVKKVTLELGSICPLIIMDDANIDEAVKATIRSGYSNVGEACTSAQRVLPHRHIYGDFVAALNDAVRNLRVGNPLDDDVDIGPMIRERDAARVCSWLEEASAGGAIVSAGGEYEGALHAPSVVVNARRGMKVFDEELFGPVVAVAPVESLDEAIEMANDTDYGLSAGIITNSLESALKFSRNVKFGNLMINSGPSWRADLMPFGGLKGSGIGKEGPRYAVQEMTETKMVVFHR